MMCTKERRMDAGKIFASIGGWGSIRVDGFGVHRIELGCIEGGERIGVVAGCE